MRAVEFQAYGGPAVLRLMQAAVPEPGPGQVTIFADAGGAHRLTGGRTSTGEPLLRVAD
jgi:NADPH:quinone reductase-like Zn-dependent oxidoreductase